MAATCNLQPGLHYFANNGKALLWAIVVFKFPVDGIVNVVRVVLPTILCAGLISWCTLVMNWITKDSKEM